MGGVSTFFKFVPPPLWMFMAPSLNTNYLLHSTTFLLRGTITSTQRIKVVLWSKRVVLGAYKAFSLEKKIVKV